MTGAGGLEQGYRRLVRWYPPLYRHRHEEEILGVLMAAARPGQRRPGVGESLDLLWSALKIRIRMILRGADSQPWAGALALTGVLIPLLMVLLKLTLFLDRGAQYGFGSPADFLIGAYGQPGAFARSFQLNPYSVALTGNVTEALTAGPGPALTLAVLVCLGWRRAAATFAVSVPLAYLGIAVTSGYTLLAAPRVAVTLYAYGLEALVLLAAPGAPRGWRALRWRPSALLAAATVAAGIGMNGGLWPLLHGRPALGRRGLIRAHGLFRVWPARSPQGIIGLIDRLFGIGPANGWGDWLVYQGTLVAVIVAALAIMLASSPVNRRVLLLLGIPFALGAVIYLCSLINPPPPGPAGNALAALPLLLLLLTAVAVLLARIGPVGPGAPSRPAASGGA
jgi:hypothetical protein